MVVFAPLSESELFATFAKHNIIVGKECAGHLGFHLMVQFDPFMEHVLYVAQFLKSLLFPIYSVAEVCYVHLFFDSDGMIRPV